MGHVDPLLLLLLQLLLLLLLLLLLILLLLLLLKMDVWRLAWKLVPSCNDGLLSSVINHHVATRPRVVFNSMFE